MPEPEKVTFIPFPMARLMLGWFDTFNSTSIFAQSLSDMYVDAIVSMNVERVDEGIPSIFD